MIQSVKSERCIFSEGSNNSVDRFAKYFCRESGQMALADCGLTDRQGTLVRIAKGDPGTRVR